jgi:hypothetical protein
MLDAFDDRAAPLSRRDEFGGIGMVLLFAH